MYNTEFSFGSELLFRNISLRDKGRYICKVKSKYELNNELIIFWNFGENKIKFTNFILFVSLFMFLIQILFTSIIVPSTQDKARSFLRDSEFVGWHL